MASHAIDERQKTVLNQVVTLHYHTCEPVGSSLISRSGALPYSPATIRNIMMTLDHRGYLVQPHTSAGRLPTDLGYRAYVDEVYFNFQPLNDTDRTQLDHVIFPSGAPVDCLRLLAEYVHRKTGQISFFFPFRHTGLRLDHLYLQGVGANQVRVLLLARCGQAFQQVLEMQDFQMTGNLLKTAEEYLNRRFHGCSLVDIRRRLTGELHPKDSQFDLLLQKVTRLVFSLEHHMERPEQISFIGFSRVFEMPEFNKIQVLQRLYSLIDEQSKIRGVITQMVQNDRDQILILIGSEMADPDLENLSVLVTKISNQGDWIGCVGILGPKRMPYLTCLQLFSHARYRISSQVYQ